MSLDARNNTKIKPTPKHSGFSRGQRVRLNYGSRSAGEITEVTPLGRYIVRYDSGPTMEVFGEFLEPETPEPQSEIPQVKVERSAPKKRERKPKEPRRFASKTEMRAHVTAELRKPTTPEQYCKQCGERMERKQFPKGLESVADFIRRKYCGVACQHAAFRISRVSADVVEEWKRLRARGWSLGDIAKSAEIDGLRISASSVFRLGSHRTIGVSQVACATAHQPSGCGRDRVGV